MEYPLPLCWSCGSTTLPLPHYFDSDGSRVHLHCRSVAAFVVVADFCAVHDAEGLPSAQVAAVLIDHHGACVAVAAPDIHADKLPREGHPGCGDRVQRLCRDHDIWSVFSKKRGPNGKPGPPVHDDRVERNFIARYRTSCG